MIELGDIVLHSDQFAMGGYWSGSEGRQHQCYVAMIPISRYASVEDFECPPVNGAWAETATAPIHWATPRPKRKGRTLSREKTSVDKPEPETWKPPKPKKFDFTTPNFTTLYTEMWNHGIIESVKKDLQLGHDDLDWYIRRLDIWLKNFDWYDDPDTTLNHIQLTGLFMEVILHEYRQRSTQVLAFLRKCFS